MNDNNVEYSVVVPVFNEDKALLELHERLQKVFLQSAKEYEIIYVNDGSTDNTEEIIGGMCGKDARIKIINFKRNLGQSAALGAGIDAAKGVWIITLDADLQNPPEEILKLFQFQNEYEFITGIRKNRKDPILKITASFIAKLGRRIVLKDTTIDTGCGLRMFKSAIMVCVPVFSHFHRFFPFLVKVAGYKVKEVHVEHFARRFGKSKYGTLVRGIEGLCDLYKLLLIKNTLIGFNKKC